MSFFSAISTNRLPEKPWTMGAVARLIVSVFLGMVMGAAAPFAIRFFQTQQQSSAIIFVTLGVCAFAALTGAMVILSLPWSLDDGFRWRLLGTVACIYGGYVFVLLAGRMITGGAELNSPVATIVFEAIFFQGVALILVHFFLRQHRQTWYEGFGLNLRSEHALVVGTCAGLLALVPTWALQAFAVWILKRLTFHPHEQQAVEILRHTEGWLSRAAMGVATILIAPCGEEVLFRGILYPTVKREYGRHVAVWGTAILFGAIHMNLGSFIPLTLLAVLLVWLYESTGNLIAPILAHAIFNAANFIALYFQQK